MLVTTLTLLLGAMPVAAANLSSLPGVVAIADSEHRDRWGVDGYHAQAVCDGTVGQDGGPGAYASDNWEVTHTVALVFPRRVIARQAVLHWTRQGETFLTPTILRLEGLASEGWQELASVQPTPAQSTGVEFEPATIAAIRVVQPPEGAAPAADRRLRLSELEVLGEAVDPPAEVDVPAVVRTVGEELDDLRAQEDARRVAPQLQVAMQGRKTRGFCAIIDRDDLALGRANVATRPWAKNLADRIIKDADWWVAKDDRFIYDLIPAGNPRAICPSFEKGCPIHGGARSSFTATLERPYVWKCKEGGEEWYDGAVVKNPATGEEVTVRDDGSGWVAPEGFKHPGRRTYFTAAYRYFLIGKLFSTPYEPDGGSEYQGGTPVTQLALAYAVTGDRRYAHKCAVMLNRLAELYRTYDGCVEGPSQRQDGYIGQTFERFLVQNVILACDLIWDELESDAELLEFLRSRGGADYDGDGQATGGDIAYNLQRNLLGYVYEYLHRLMPYFDGDFLMYEMTALAALANCLQNPAIAEEAMQSDVGLRVMLTNSWFRDGKFIYDSCGYNAGNAQTPLLIAEWLHGLQAPPDIAQPVDVYNAPDYRVSMLYDFLRHIDCDGRVPSIGDTGGTRSSQLRLRPPYAIYDERALIRLPAERDYYLRRLQAAAANGNLEALRNGNADWWLLFHAQPGPDPVPDAAQPAPASHLFDDSGIAILRAGAEAETRQHVCMTFSKGAYGHGHTDKLAINLFRHGWDFSADLGYPTTWTDIKAGGWETDTASHCTVMLDETEQRGNVIGKLHVFSTQPACDVVEASCEAAYPKCSLYRRTVALVRDGVGEPLYTADIFRVAGAKTRDYLFHSLGDPKDMSVIFAEGNPKWESQTEGSLAGADVAPMTRGGYGFIFDIQEAASPSDFIAMWRPQSGTSQPDRYLLTKRSFTNATVEFTLTRTGQAGGEQERSVFVFATDPADVSNRRVIMLPVESFEVGKPAKVRVEVHGGEAQMSIGGKPAGHVDVTGAAPESGSVGFLHYYNYAWDLTDLRITPEGEEPIIVDLGSLDPGFWGLIQPTYSASGGVLRARDTQRVGLDLHMLGAPGREIIRGKAEGYGVRGKSPFEGHLIVRERVEDPEQITTFAAVLEAGRTPGRVNGNETLPVEGGTPGEVLAMGVMCYEPDGTPRDDIILSALDPTVEHRLSFWGQEITFRGRFGLASTIRHQVTALTLVGGGHFTWGEQRLETPADLRGHIVGTESDAVTIRPDETSPKPDQSLIGRKLMALGEGYVCPAVYTIDDVQPQADGTWRLGLNMPLLVARGVVGAVGDGGFSSRTPLMKLKVNPGLFDGKVVKSSPDGVEVRLRSATVDAFTPKELEALAQFAPGGEYYVYDIGVGDSVEVLSEASWAR